MGWLSEKFLYLLIPTKIYNALSDFSKDDVVKANTSYPYKQYNICVRNGFKYELSNKNILEIGCGHGGISVFLANNGAKHVVGIDINKENLKIGNDFISKFKKDKKIEFLPVELLYNDVHNLDFENNYFDYIIADNVFEHFDNNLSVLKECKRVLKNDGKIITNSMPSIYSKYGPHLKKGIGLPWVNLFFSETTIINVLKKISKEYPIINQLYPGLKNNPIKISDLRRYKDLNYITHKKILQEVKEAGLDISSFRSSFKIHYINIYAKIFSKLFFKKFSIINDFLSISSSFTIKKQ